MCTPLSAGGTGEGGEPPTKFSRKEGDLTRPQLLEGVAGKEGGDFLKGGWLQFSHKKQIKI